MPKPIDFENYVREQARIAAAERVGPNSPGYDDLWDALCADNKFREDCLLTLCRERWPAQAPQPCAPSDPDGVAVGCSGVGAGAVWLALSLGRTVHQFNLHPAHATLIGHQLIDCAALAEVRDGESGVE